MVTIVWNAYGVGQFCEYVVLTGASLDHPIVPWFIEVLSAGIYAPGDFVYCGSWVHSKT